jgi:hypothetical protein
VVAPAAAGGVAVAVVVRSPAAEGFVAVVVHSHLQPQVWSPLSSVGTGGGDGGERWW